VDGKARNQCDRIIIQLPDPPDGTSEDVFIDKIIDEVNLKRGTPGSGCREDLEELFVYKSDGTLQRLFPGGGVN